MRIFPIFLLLLAFASFAAAQNTADVPKPESERVEDVYLARDDGEGKAGDVVKSFEVTDIPIHCIVMLREALPASVKMELVAVKVAGVKPESRVVTAAYTTSQGQDRVFFLGRPQGAWVPGDYRIDIFVDGKKERSLDFEMKGRAAPAGASNFAPIKRPPAKRPRRN